jgi:pimeloyl-ACP methyl ester carboxylesterase
MLELVQRLVGLEWRRRGARIREVTVSGCRVWYAEFHPRPRDLEELRRAAARAGTPPPRGPVRPPILVLLHGLGASSASFYPIIPFLRRGYRVIAPDLPGYGWSRPRAGREFLSFPELVDVAERFVARVAPRGAYVAGNSMGGWIAAKLAARRPDLVHALALINPGGPALRAEDWVDFVRLVMAEERGTIDEWLHRMFHRPPLVMRLLAGDVLRLMRHPSVTQLMASLTADDFLSDDEIAQVKSPAVLVWGEKDRLIPDGCRAFYLKKLKGVRYEPVPDCGHCPQLECPHRTAEILLQLRGLPRRADADPPQLIKASSAPAAATGSRRSGSRMPRPARAPRRAPSPQGS